MAVNKVVYYGETLIDISDSTVAANRMLSGTIGYSCDGERVVGTYTPVEKYNTAITAIVNIPSNAWTLQDGKFKYSVDLEISDQNLLFAQVVLNSDPDVAYYQNEQFDLIDTITVNRGTILFSCIDGDVYPYCDLEVMLTSINKIGVYGIPGLIECDGRSISYYVRAGDWTNQNGINTVEFDISISEDEIAFIIPLLEMSDTPSENYDFFKSISYSMTENGHVRLSRLLDNAINIDTDVYVLVKIFKEV